METEGTATVRLPHLAFDVAVVLLTSSAAIYASNIAELGRGFPFFVSSAATIFATFVLVMHLWRYYLDRRRLGENSAGTDETDAVENEEDDPEEGSDLPSIARVAGVLSWFIGYAILIWLIGLVPATAVYLFVFLRFETRMRTPMALLAALAVAVGLSVLMDVLGMGDPPTVLGFWSDARSWILGFVPF